MFSGKTPGGAMGRVVDDEGSEDGMSEAAVAPASVEELIAFVFGAHEAEEATGLDRSMEGAGYFGWEWDEEESTFEDDASDGECCFRIQGPKSRREEGLLWLGHRPNGRLANAPDEEGDTWTGMAATTDNILEVVAWPQGPMTLRGVELSCCHVPDAAFRSLATRILSAAPQLVHFRISEVEFNADAMRLVAAALAGCGSLRILAIQSECLSEAGIVALAGVLPNFEQLEALDITARSCGPEGILAITAGLTSCTQLFHLGLGFGDMVEEDGTVLAAAMSSWPKLGDLDLHGTALGPGGVGALSMSVPLALELIALDLSMCNVADDGMELLAKVLPGCVMLKTIGLADNEIGDQGVEAFAKAMPLCPALVWVGLSCNPITTEGAHALAAVLPECAKLETLDLDSSDVDPRGVEALFAAMKACGRRINIGLEPPTELRW